MTNRSFLWVTEISKCILGKRTDESVGRNDCGNKRIREITWMFNTNCYKNIKLLRDKTTIRIKIRIFEIVIVEKGCKTAEKLKNWKNSDI